MFGIRRQYLVLLIWLLPVVRSAWGLSMEDREPANAVFSDPRVAALARAACAGDLHDILRQLRLGADANFIGKDGLTPLFWAQGCRNKVGMEALLKAGANPNYALPFVDGHPPRGGISAVWKAATLEDPSFLNLLLKHGGDPNAVDQLGGTSALARAFDFGLASHTWDNYYTLLNAGADINRAYGGITIAYRAAALNQFDKVVELVHRGYRGDLMQLGGLAQSAMLYPGDPQLVWRTRLVELLKSKGVQFPVISEPEKRYAGTVQLQENGMIWIRWWSGHRGNVSVPVREQLVSPHDPLYAKILKRVGALKPLTMTYIPRAPGDLEPGPAEAAQH